MPSKSHPTKFFRWYLFENIVLVVVCVDNKRKAATTINHKWVFCFTTLCTNYLYRRSTNGEIYQVSRTLRPCSIPSLASPIPNIKFALCKQASCSSAVPLQIYCSSAGTAVYLERDRSCSIPILQFSVPGSVSPAEQFWEKPRLSQTSTPFIPVTHRWESSHYILMKIQAEGKKTI